MTASASDAPQRQAGTRTRSGNAMLRTRTAILDAAAECVERQGVRRTTMGDVAAAGRVAKATLYNHFRAKGDVLTALVAGRVATIAQECEAIAAGLPDARPVPGLDTPARPSGLVPALEHAATALASSRPLRRVAAEEPALLLPLLVPGQDPRWEQVRGAVAGVLTAAAAPVGPGEVELVLRWLLSQLLWPATAESVRTGAQAVGRSVTLVAAPGASAVPSQGRGSLRRDPAGLGWPSEPVRLRTR